MKSMSQFPEKKTLIFFNKSDLTLLCCVEASTEDQELSKK